MQASSSRNTDGYWNNGGKRPFLFRLDKEDRPADPEASMMQDMEENWQPGVKRDRQTESFWQPGRKRDRQTESSWRPGRKRDAGREEEDRQTESSWTPGRKRDTGRELEEEQQDLPEYNSGQGDWVAQE